MSERERESERGALKTKHKWENQGKGRKRHREIVKQPGGLL